ncbi:MAG: tyrosine-type recombinase/integrase [Novosphingobium sp.]
MPLEPYLRNGKWWARGRIEHNGTPITEYQRYSTKALSEAGAREWCSQEEARVIRRHILGPEAAAKEEAAAFTFAEACLLYEADAKTANYLLAILQEWGDKPVVEITPKMVRDLGKQLYPDAGTVTWTRQVVTPIRSVINNAHDLGKCAPIKIKGYDRQERARQDKRRGSTGRTKYLPGSWEWILQFCEHAEQRVRALALTMFSTGARISQAMEMHPKHFDAENKKLCIPGAKGMGDRWLDIPDWLVAELKELPPFLYPRGWEHKDENRRLFGYAERSSPRKAWNKAIEKAKIEFIPFHSAGRHGFGQELNVRHAIDEKSAAAFGGWSDVNLMKRTYTHAEEIATKVHEAQLAGMARAEAKTKIKLRNAT